VRVWTKKSACGMLAWSAVLTIMVTAGMCRSHPAQANVRIASSTTEISLADRVSVAAVSVTAVSPAARYVVQPGDTLSGIAARLAVRGGWQALYAANRHAIGTNPNVIRPGTGLVLPGGQALTRYVVTSGNTLTRIAAALAVRGGWQALYAANRHAIGADPDVIRPGTVLVIPHPMTEPPSGGNPGQRTNPEPPSAAAGTGHHMQPAGSPATGMPSGLTALLLAAGLLIGAAFLAEPVLAVRRRRAARAARAGGFGAVLAGPGRARRRMAARSWPGRARIAARPGPRPVSSWLTTTGWW
jgi:LysM repeat protein